MEETWKKYLVDKWIDLLLAKLDAYGFSRISLKFKQQATNKFYKWLI